MSLGPNCYPKTILVRKNLMKKKHEGQLSYPFDLAWYHSSRYITDFLKNDFDGFLSDLKYSSYSGSWDNGEKINFSHEAFIGPKEKNKLIKIYERRIKNFRRVIKKDNPVLFLQILKNKTVGQDCNNTYKVLKKLCPDREMVFVVVDCAGVLDGVRLDKDIHSIKIPFPDGITETDVFKEEFYTSQAGIDFENKIADFIKKVIEKEFDTKPIIF